MDTLAEGDEIIFLLWENAKENVIFLENKKKKNVTISSCENQLSTH